MVDMDRAIRRVDVQVEVLLDVRIVVPLTFHTDTVPAFVKFFENQVI